jgi:hypothetical protein
MPNVPSATLLPEIEIDALRLVWTANYAVGELELHRAPSSVH